MTPVLLSDRECLTYRALTTRSNHYARWALERGLGEGDFVCLLMANRPEYFAIWLGTISVGGVVALLNTNLVVPSLAHCIHVVRPKYLIAAAEFLVLLATALAGLAESPALLTHGTDDPSFYRIDVDINRQSGALLARDEQDCRPSKIVHFTSLPRHDRTAEGCEYQSCSRDAKESLVCRYDGCSARRPDIQLLADAT